jgi:serine/threonine protein kinase/Tfp pilus assembly protein PilF
MPTDLTSNDKVTEPSIGLWAKSPALRRESINSPSDELGQNCEPATGFAPSFRELLGTGMAADHVVNIQKPEPTADEIPKVPGYEVIAELGRGGMGIVYQARHCSLKRQVALKMILGGLHANATARMRFRTEAEAVARLQHANIVQIYEVGEFNGRPFLSLEYIDGGSLFRKISGRVQPERAAARLVEALARAVHYMHQRGILHRDLKPNNVLLTSEGAPKISDFGLAKILDAANGLTLTETMLGTPSYMAPEQAAGDNKRVSASVDVYSLGAILYELLTGRAPFQGATPLSTLEQVRTLEPVPPRRLRQSVSLDLNSICLKCLEKEPSKRYPSAIALAEDLLCFIEKRPVLARPTTLRQKLWKSMRRRSTFANWALGAAALVGLLLTSWSYFNSADRFARHEINERYQQFIQRRNEAHLYGLLTPDEGSIFLGAEVDANLKTAESAAREALALAGVNVDSTSTTIDPAFGDSRKSAIAADCYTLLMVLASVRDAQHRQGEEPHPHGEESLRILDQTLQFDVRTRAYHLRRANILEHLGNHEEAKKHMHCAASLPPQNALDHFLIGEEQYRRNEWEQATNSFKLALNLQPSHFWAQFFHAVCNLKLQQWETAKAGLNACLSQQPDFVWAYLFRSIANEKLQALQEAEADFQKVLQLNPNEDARYVLFLTRGILHFNQKELERAASDFRSAMALKAEQYNAYVNLAQVYLAQREFEHAAEQMEVALRFRPPILVVVGYHVECGRILLRDKKYEQAIQACETALALASDQPQPHEVRGRALLALGHYQQAESSFDQYLRLGGKGVADTFRGRGMSRMKLGRYPDAVEDYTRVLECTPDAEIYQHRGWAYFFADAWKLALRDFSKAIELDPEMSDAYIGRGLARASLGEFRESVADGEMALLRKPTSPEMMHNVACIFAQAVASAETSLQGQDRQALTASYRGRAVEAIRETLALLPPEDRLAFWQDKIMVDEALAPIRNDEKFKRLKDECLR